MRIILSSLGAPAAGGLPTSPYSYFYPRDVNEETLTSGQCGLSLACYYTIVQLIIFTHTLPPKLPLPKDCVVYFIGFLALSVNVSRIIDPLLVVIIIFSIG